MVGWSRRSREASIRRHRWWNSLTEEEKVTARAQEKAYDKVVMRWMLAFFGIPIVICIVWSLFK
jgi:hypothetical protein